MTTTRAAVLGTGLIGASIGAALRAQGWAVTGWDPSVHALTVAAERGALTATANTAEEAGAEAEIVFLAGPLQATLESVRGLATDGIITDTAGVKVPVVEAARGRRFVGGHPMAGREHAGPEASSAGLFRGAAWVLCHDGAAGADLEAVAAAVRVVGANPVVMSAAEHDRVVAAVSHLPHLLAVALVNLVADDPAAADLVSGSFRDLTRVASSESAWWPDLLVANAGHVGVAVARLEERLGELRARIEAADLAGLTRILDRARSTRAGMAPPVARVQVVLQDRPGEIAAVGHALQTSKVDVRDLQLRHAVHGGGGILTLAVRPGEEQALRQALVAEGFQLDDGDG